MASNGNTTANSAHLDLQPQQHVEVVMAAGEHLSVGAQKVTNVTTAADGSLVLHFSNDATLVVKNFSAIASMNPHPTITLDNGQKVDLAQYISADHAKQDATNDAVFPTLASEGKTADASNAHTINIAKPNAHQNVVVNLHEGDHYKFAFTMTDPVSVKDDHGQLVISFKDGGEIIIPNYDAVKDASNAPTIMLKDGAELAATDLNTTLAQASQLNAVEAAAGGNGGGGAGSGFGFGSIFTASSLNGLNPIGPINPTELQYRAPDRTPTPALEIDRISPNLEVADVSVYERDPANPTGVTTPGGPVYQSTVALDIHAAPENGHQQITITVEGIQPGWSVDTAHSGGTYTAATGTWTINVPVGQAFDGGPTLTPPNYSDHDLDGLKVTETVTDTQTGNTATVSSSFNIITDAVAEVPNLTASATAVDEGHAAPITINTSPVDPDGSESITKIVISGVPADAALNHGTNNHDGTWTLTTADLTGLTLTASTTNPHYSDADNGGKPIKLTITSTTTETTHDGEITTDNNSATATTTVDVSFHNTVDAPLLTVGDIIIKENPDVANPAAGTNPNPDSKALDIHATLNDPVHDQLVITVKGFQPGWHVDTTVSGGTVSADGTTWTLTVPAGQDFHGGPTVTAPAYSDLDLSGLQVSATEQDAHDTSLSATSTATENVIVDAVADPVSITAANTAGNENAPIALHINIGASADTDGSEHVTKVVISGFPAGTTFSEGALDTVTGKWVIDNDTDIANINKLTMTTPTHVVGDVNLTITATNTEQLLGAGNQENYTDDNSIDTTATMTVHVDHVINAPTLNVGDVTIKENPDVANPAAHSPYQDSQQLNVSAHLNDPGAHDVLTVTIHGIPSGWDVSSQPGGTVWTENADGNWVATATGTQTITGPIVEAPAYSDADLSGLQVSATVSDSSDTTVAPVTISGTANVIVDAVADPVSITAANTSGDEHTPIALHINIGASADTDGSEHVTKVVISGFPTGTTFSEGALDTATGKWVIDNDTDIANINKLTMTTPTHAVGDVNLTITATNSEKIAAGDQENYTPDNSIDTTATMTVHVDHVLNPGNLTVGDITIKENPAVASAADHDPANPHFATSAALNITASLNDPGPHDVMVVTVAGFKDGWTVDTSTSGGTYDAATHTWTIVLSGTETLHGGPTVTAPAYSDADLSGLQVTAVTQDTSDFSLPPVSVSATENVNVDAVADPVSITTHAASGDEGHTIPLSINIGASADTDGSEHVSKVVISGFPAGTTFSEGSLQANGTWAITNPADIANIGHLTVTTPAHFSGDVNLSITATNVEGVVDSATNHEGYTGDNSIDTTATLALHVNDLVSCPTVTAPDTWVKEDTSVDIKITATLNNPDAGDHLTVVIKGFLPGWTVDTSHSGGTMSTDGTTWTLDLPPGVTTFTGGPTITPPANSDVDMPNLTVTATSTTSGGATSSSTTTEHVYVDAVVDHIAIAAQDSSGSDNTPVPVHIQFTPSGDTDGSEATTIVIKGVPAGDTLNVGTKDADGNWHVSPSDLPNLTLSSVRGITGDIHLTVVATETEKAPLNTTGTGNHENDLSDNTFTATTTLTVHVQDTAPIFANAPTDTVDETNLAAGNVTVHDQITANFGLDTPGSVAATSAASFSAGGSLKAGALTSEGAAVTVTLSGNTYTGTANGHTVFTLVLQADGQYDFTLKAPLDHADGSNPNDSIALNFGVTATDADGTHTAGGTIHINVLDDAPTAHNDVNTFDAGLGHADGNVVTGANGGTGAADTLSVDAPNHITQVSFGSHTVDVPATGTASIHGDHGTLTISADGSYTYTLDAGATGAGGSTTTTTTTAHSFTGPAFPTDLSEGVAINNADKADLGELHSNMVINANTQVTGAITFDGAGYTNSLGAFTIGADGTLQAAQMVATSINGPGANFSLDASAGAKELGFFLVADGFTTNNAYAGIDFSKGTLTFEFDYGQSDARTAKITDDGNHVSLVYTDGSGHSQVIEGPIYYTTDQGGSNSLNPDCLVHTISGTNGSDHSTLTIGFEDLPNGGDKDYNDTVFNVQLTDHTTTTTTTPATGTSDVFNYTLGDGDGDHSNATLTLNGLAPTLLVGTNTNDTDGSTTTYTVGGGHGTITGGGASDILIGDNGGSSTVAQAKNYNVELVLDVSGSMGQLSDPTSKYALLVQAVTHLINDLHNYTGGEVMVDITPFDSTAHTGGAFDVSTAAGQTAALAFLQHMGGGGVTNYEGALQAADTWLSGSGPQHDATTVTYFITDGEPNHYVQGAPGDHGYNAGASGSTQQSMDQILGTGSDGDNTNEVATTQHLSDSVIGVGINVGSAISNINLIDSSGHAINVHSGADLDAALQAASPLHTVAAVGADHIVGGNGDDIIFGDSVNTDTLAHAQGLTTAAGDGWDVFTQLEAGHGTDTSWTRADTISYIQTHTAELGAETVDSLGHGRTGGNDILEGGAGNDIIFGQEGNDTIYGGAGNNTLYGGSGADHFVVKAGDVGTGVNTIKDFSTTQGDVLDISDVLQGHDVTATTLHNFVSATASGNNTIVAVDTTGTGTHFQTVAVLEGVHIDIDTLTNHGNLVA